MPIDIKNFRRRERIEIDPSRIFTTGSEKTFPVTHGKRYVFATGTFWQVESVDGNIAQCQEITVSEYAEIEKLLNEISALDPSVNLALYRAIVEPFTSL